MTIRFFADEKATTRRRFTIQGEEHYLDLRTDLSASEWDRLETGFISKVTADGGITLDMAQATAQRLALWIAGWSFTTNTGAQVKPSVDRLGALTGRVSERVKAIVDEHEEAMRAERDAEMDPTPAASLSEVSSETETPPGPGPS